MFSAAGKSAVTSGYNINNSLRFRSSASAYLSRTPASAGNQQKFTWSGWVKIGYFNVGYLQAADGNSGNRMTSWYMRGLGGTGTLEFEHFDGTTTYNLTTSAVFRDPSAWYHITVAVDTTQASSANRTKIYVNGNEQTVTGTYVPQNTTLYVNGTTIQAIGSRKNISAGYGNYFDGYMTEVNFVDGSALTPSSFGETDGTTGVWKPKRFGGSFGTNGFYLPFSDIATTSGSNAGLGKDFSGNGNYWTTNNISVTSGVTYDAMTDSPTNTSATAANYCVLNPLDYKSVAPQQANLYVPATDYAFVRGTFWVSTGKWYYEWTSSAGGGLPPYVGVADANITSYLGVTTSGISWYGHSDALLKPFTATAAISATALASGDIVGVAFDCDAGTIRYYKNNNLVYTDSTLPAGTLISPVLLSTFGGGAWNNATFNFGQRPFSYTPPTGHVALNTFNLPDSTIKKGNLHMNATTYTGTNGSPTTQVISSNFQPDLLWFKKRSASYDHALIDSVRGINKQLYSNLTNAEGTDGDVLAAIGSTSFTVGNSNYSNYGTLVAWTWKAGGTSTVNTSGTISSNVSVNTTAGFSVVTYTGTGANATVGHGLGVSPAMIIIKSRSGVTDWPVYHTSIGNTKSLFLNRTIVADTSISYWNNTSPTSSVFNIGYGADVNPSSANIVAYCFAEIAGFSRFGSYTGNGSTDGPFVYLGFRPKFILFKRATGGVANWLIYDTSRDTYNQMGNILYPSLSDAEYVDSNKVDFLSNGVKIRSSQTDLNTNGNTYIYAAYAENPFKNALAR